MDLLSSFTALADAVRAAVKPNNFRSLSGFSNAKSAIKAIDGLFLLRAETQEDQLHALGVLQDLLRSERYQSEGLDQDSEYPRAIASFEKAVLAQIALIENEQRKRAQAVTEQHKRTTLESIAQEREQRLQEPSVDLLQTWTQYKETITAQNLRSVSKFKSGTAAVSQIDDLLSKYSALQIGSNTELKTLDAFIHELRELPAPAGQQNDMAGESMVRDVRHVISSAAMKRLAQLQYEVDTRPENAARNWNKPFA